MNVNIPPHPTPPPTPRVRNCCRSSRSLDKPIYTYKHVCYIYIYHKNIYTICIWLVGWTPLKNMKVSWDDYPISYIMENKRHVPNHQPGIYVDTWTIAAIAHCRDPRLRSSHLVDVLQVVQQLVLLLASQAVWRCQVRAGWPGSHGTWQHCGNDGSMDWFKEKF